jgi:anthranilate phosphoribosyltransferase
VDLPATFHALLDHQPLSEPAAESLFESILEGRLDPAQIGAVLALIQARAPAADELVGAARAMRRHVTPVAIAPPPPGLSQVVLDTCGTGGALKTFNISTAVALVAAAASPHHSGGTLRVLIAKHGNRSRTGRGSAEVLAALGVNVEAPPPVQARCLDQAGLCFCFAPAHHPAMKHAAPARRALPFPTIFNLLGPLTNPAAAPRQLLGVYDARYVPLLAEALRRLGTDRAMVVHGHGGMDELSTLGPSTLCHASPAATRPETLDPRSLGLPAPVAADLTARDLAHSAAIIRDILAGHRGPPRDLVLLNAAAALLVAGATDAWQDALARAAEAIDSGRAVTTLQALIAASNEPS